MANKAPIEADNSGTNLPLTNLVVADQSFVSPAGWTIMAAGTVIVAASLVAYGNSFSGPFIFDDKSAIIENLTLRHWGSALLPPSNHTTGGRPLVNLSYALNYASSGLNVWGYHAFNLCLHILAGLTVFGIVRRTLRRAPLNERFGAAALWLALAVAVIWAVHPLQTEVVTYISQRSESLMGLFYLLTLYCFIRGVENRHQESGNRSQEKQSEPWPSIPSTGLLNPGFWLLASIFCCLLGVLSKEVIATAPLMIFLYDRTFVAGSFLGAWRLRWKYYIGLAGTWLLLAILMMTLRQRDVGFGQGVSSWEYALTSCQAVVLYLKLAVWPQPLVLDYGIEMVHHVLEVWPDVLVLAVLLAGVAVALWRWPTVGFAGAWFFVILAPTSSVIPIILEPIAERRVYLPLAAVVVLFVLGLYSLLGRRSWVLFVALAAGLGWLSARRNEDYRSAAAIWADVVAKRPGNVRALNNLGQALASIPGRSSEAMAEFEAALRIEPHDAGTHDNLGVVLSSMPGRLPEAIAEFEAALRIDPNDADAHDNLGLALSKIAGRMTEAVAQYQAALQIEPDNAMAHINLGSVLAKIPGRLSDAMTEDEAALKIQPDSFEAHCALGEALAQVPDRWPEAISEYEAALRIKPEGKEAHTDLGIVLANIPGRLLEAVSHFEAALRIDPDYAEAHNNLGLALASIPDRLPEAISHLEAALRIKPDYAEAHNNLGVALAKIPGRSSDAIAHFEAALRIRPDFAEAHYDLGMELMNDPDQLPGAIQHFEAAVKLNPNNANAQNGLGVSLAKSGRIDEAMPHFEAAVRIEPNFASAHANLGRALAYLGRSQEAEQEFRTALAIEPDFEEARQALERLERQQ